MTDRTGYRVTGRRTPAARGGAWAMRRLRGVRPPSSREGWIGAAVVACVAVLLAVQALSRLVQWTLATWWALPMVLIFGFGTVWLWSRARILRARASAHRLQRLRHSLEELDQMSPDAFEFAVRDLMLRDGITARRVGGSNDKAADVIGRHPPTRRTIVVQCKHTTRRANVKAEVIYQVNGTAGPAHQAHAAVVVTNGGFTRPARDNAADFGIALIDRHELERWADQGQSLVDFLGLRSRRAGRYRLRHRPMAGER